MTEELLRLQAGKLRTLLRDVHERSPFYRERLERAGFDPKWLEAIGDQARDEDLHALLDRLPLLTKDELQEEQRLHPPYGRTLTEPRERYVRLHQTSGTTGAPLRWVDTAESWQWFLDCWKEVYRGMGLRASDRLLFPFSFGPFIGFWGAFEAARQLGRFSLAAGGLSTLARLRLIDENAITVLACTPTYALRMAEVAAVERVDLRASSVRALVVAGEPGGSIPATRELIEGSWGARVYDHCGMTETGASGFECHETPGGLHVIEEEFIAEVLIPGKTRRSAPGEAGELVLTNLGRIANPVIRYRTGDLVRAEGRGCACGRPTLRLAGGILGRLDQMVFVRGNNVYPGVVESILRRFREVAEYRVVVLESGDLTDLRVEIEPVPGLDRAKTANLADVVTKAIRDALHFRAAVRVVPEASLPRFEMKASRFVREGAAVVREKAAPRENAGAHETTPARVRGIDAG